MSKLLTPIEIWQAYDSYEFSVTFDHKPTEKEIQMIMLTQVAKAQLDKDTEAHQKEIEELFDEIGKYHTDAPFHGF